MQQLTKQIDNVESKVGVHINAGKTKLVQIGLLVTKKSTQFRLKVE